MKFSKNTPVKIVMIGAGGTGGNLAPYLYRMAAYADREIDIVIIDGDIVQKKNLQRQNFVEGDVGENKARILAQRYSSAFRKEAKFVEGYITKKSQLQTYLKPESAN